MKNGRLTIRAATGADGAAITRLAALDFAPAPRGAVLIADIDGEPWAALGIDDRRSVADPFRPSRAVVEPLRHAGLRAAL